MYIILAVTLTLTLTLTSGVDAKTADAHGKVNGRFTCRHADCLQITYAHGISEKVRVRILSMGIKSAVQKVPS